MSILKKPYEISIWDDIWDEGQQKFVENRYAIIGSDTMQSQNRVLEPNLTRNVNGTKKLTFKMCKRYKDSITGKTIINPFSDQLISERKVKLKYGDEWFDFIVKNIQEDSSNYIYTYQLEDALVNELSKNGFGIVLDDTLQNNSGTAQELAESVLKDTDWKVDETLSDTLVQTVEEPLVYITIPEGTKAYQVLDPNRNNSTGCLGGVTKGAEIDVGGCTALAFYSSLRNKPVFFQFIILGKEEHFGKIEAYGEESVRHDENRVINEDNCQYYIQYLDESSYVSEPVYGFFLPKGFAVQEQSLTNGIENDADTTISSWHRGARYGFSQKTVFEPKLERYVNVYEKDGLEDYRGYVETKFVSPELIQNIISNTSFKNDAGWTGAYFGGTPTAEKASIRNVFGRFEGGEFIEALTALSRGTFNTEATAYNSYMKLWIPSPVMDSKGPVVVNSGPFDNRVSIGYMEKGSRWMLAAEIYDEAGKLLPNLKNCGLRFSLQEAIYNPSGAYKGAYTLADSRGLELRQDNDAVEVSLGGQNIFGLTFTVTKNDYTSKKDFKDKSKLRLIIESTDDQKTVFYIKNIQLFEMIEYKKEDGTFGIVLPEEQNEETMGGIISNKYYYYHKDEPKAVQKKEDFQPSTVLTELDNITYAPVFNMDAQKIRSVSVKESNYFNILQSIAETFEAWVLILVDRDELGGILSKKVIFKRFIGEDNFANFKYGVNLKNIKRTYESKQIVTKLIVKDNSNEFAENGFCTIARAGANPLGENFIYDFQYYFNQGLLDPMDYLNTLYSYEVDDLGPVGGDVGNDNTSDYKHTNLIGYYPRLRKINDKLTNLENQLRGLSTGLLQLQADAEIQKQTCVNAIQEIEEYKNEFEFLTSKSIDAGYKPQGAADSPAYWPENITSRSDVKKVLQKYAEVNNTFSAAKKEYIRLAGSQAFEELTGLSAGSNVKGLIPSKEKAITELETEYDTVLQWKAALNKAFFSKYSRFIQEGTWISEEYTDDEKYYTDALSVLYNSCYPKVAYQINVLELSGLEGYNNFSFSLGDKTYVEDPNFFGTDQKMQVILTELNEYLDSPEKNTVKVQNFKNQFQDLFQKITATVQQAQYNTGSYEKAVALAEASQAKKMSFLTDALTSASAMLTTAGQQSVTWGNDGITVTDLDSPCNSIRMIGGAILLSKQDKNGLLKWTTGITYDGVSASLITAGVLNAGEIQIMNSDEPMFRWDSYGITAFDFETQEGIVVSGSIKHNQFVRMDKFGIYGVDGTKNGLGWTPENVEDVLRQSTFALTREGLLIDKADKIKVNIGYNNGKVIEILSKSPDYLRVDDPKNPNTSKKTVFSIDETGNAQFAGKLLAASGHFVGSISVGSLTKDSQKLAEDAISGVHQDPVFSVNENGIVRIRKGGIYLGEPLESSEADYADSNSNFDTYKYPFSVNDDGVLRAVSGHFGGWDLSQNGLKYEGTRDQNKYGMILTPLGVAGYSVNEIADNGSASAVSKTNAAIIVHGGANKVANFMVTTGGTLYANGAHICGSIRSSNGIIGGWKITSDSLQRYVNGVVAYHFGGGHEEDVSFTSQAHNGNTTETVNLSLALKINDKFKVTQDGTLYASGVHISGSGNFSGYVNINKGGNIAGWIIDDNSIRIGTLGAASSMWLCRNGTTTSAKIANSDSISGWCIAVGTSFGVTKEGTLHAKNANIQGTITADKGSIGGMSFYNNNGIPTLGVGNDKDNTPDPLMIKGTLYINNPTNVITGLATYTVAGGLYFGDGTYKMGIAAESYASGWGGRKMRFVHPGGFYFNNGAGFYGDITLDNGGGVYADGSISGNSGIINGGTFTYYFKGGRFVFDRDYIRVYIDGKAQYYCNWNTFGKGLHNVWDSLD